MTIAKPLGFDLPPARRGGTPYDHVFVDPNGWCFCIGPEVEASPSILEFPRKLAVTQDRAVEIAGHILRGMQAAYDVGQKHGQADAQRFFRLALGVEEPTRQERAYWDHPVPLKEGE